MPELKQNKRNAGFASIPNFPIALTRIFGWAIIGVLAAFLFNNFLTNWLGWPGVRLLANPSTGGHDPRIWLQVAIYAAAALAAAADKSGYTPSWDDMFRMNRQQLEQAARTLSRDESLAPECQAYLMQHLLAARWICAQQRAKQLRRVGKATTSPATVGGRLL